MDPLIITVASTYVNWTKNDSPYMPETPQEIVRILSKHTRRERQSLISMPETKRETLHSTQSITEKSSHRSGGIVI